MSLSTYVACSGSKDEYRGMATGCFEDIRAIGAQNKCLKASLKIQSLWLDPKPRSDM
jgi:hypothetical protein